VFYSAAHMCRHISWQVRPMMAKCCPGSLLGTSDASRGPRVHSKSPQHAREVVILNPSIRCCVRLSAILSVMLQGRLTGRGEKQRETERKGKKWAGEEKAGRSQGEETLRIIAIVKEPWGRQQSREGKADLGLVLGSIYDDSSQLLLVPRLSSLECKEEVGHVTPQCCHLPLHQSPHTCYSEVWACYSCIWACYSGIRARYSGI